MGAFRMKRIYSEADSADGLRVLVDRLWPRGVAKEDARLAAWMREVAPSPALRTWFGHDPDKFAEFSRRYEEELADSEIRPALEKLRRWAREQTVTLVYAAKDETCNHVVVLKRYLEQGADASPPGE